MPINAYTGLMGSGKSYEVVSSVIVPAVAAGRRVVTNIDGVDAGKIKAYVHERMGVPFDMTGDIVVCTDDEVSSANFFPHRVPKLGRRFRPDSLKLRRKFKFRLAWDVSVVRVGRRYADVAA